MKILMTTALLVLLLAAQAQVKIGNNPGTINANSLLEMESTNKGFLPPRVALNSSSSVSPLSGTVPAGMLVYSTGGTLADGYYYWNGTEWKLVATSELNVVTKTATTTLTKKETFVLASNDITLTLPAITSADNGLAITIKNVGTHIHVITIQGNAGETIDSESTSTLTKYCAQTFVATGGNWVIKTKENRADELLDVSDHSSWTTLQEVVEFLNVHMTGPTVVRLGENSYDVPATLVIDLPYPVTFQGLSFGTTTIAAASGLAGKPMFRCVSDCNFKMLQFDASTLPGYGTVTGEDAIRLVGSGTYHEVKDCSIDKFNNAIYDSSNAELWLFECDILNAKANGILVNSSMDSVVIKVAETDFIHCKVGIDLERGNKATIQLLSGGYYNASSSDTAIVYDPSTFTSFNNIHVSGNLWNNVGKYIYGFDFSRADGRDANAYIEGNAGEGDHSPSCKITVNNNVSTTTVTTTGTWVKAVWTNTSSVTTKWTVANNKITYQSANRRNAYIIITGSFSCSSPNKTASVGFVKNGNTATILGQTDVRLSTSGQPYQFSTVVYLQDVGPGDYFELYCNSSVSGDVLTFHSVQWLTDAK
ncbi:MAG TPA: hypothetical protein VF487_17815 [Chitinophagaceae bacterium]